jgi:hypothetical protein
MDNIKIIMKKYIQETVKNILLGNFRLALIENGSNEKSGIGFLGDVNFSIHDKWKPITDITPYLFTSLFKDSVDGIDKLPICVKNYTYKINDDVELILIVDKSSYGLHFQLTLSYHKLLLGLYKNYTPNDGSDIKIEMLYDFDFTKIDLNLFKEEKTSLWRNSYFFYNQENANWSEILKLCIIDDTFYWTVGLVWIKRDYHDILFPTDLFKILNIKKVVIQTELINNDFVFELPDDFQILIDVKIGENKDDFFTQQPIEHKIDRIVGFIQPKDRKYIEPKYKNVIDKIVHNEEVMVLSSNLLLLEFKFHNITGQVYTDEYVYNNFKKHYMNMDEVTLNFIGEDVKFKVKDFMKLFKTKKVNGKKKETEAYYYFNNKIGYTGFWNPKFEERNYIV